MPSTDAKKYILYGVGAEAEYFFYQNQDILHNISFCIDRKNVNTFYGLEVFRIEAVDMRQVMDTHYIIVAAGGADIFEEIKKGLCGYGLCEWKHFIWSKVFRRKVVVINANCHGDAVKKYLVRSASFCNGYSIYPIPEVHLGEGVIDTDLLRHTDVYIHQDIRKENAIGYQLSDEYVRQYLPENVVDICIPNFVGMGKWMYPGLGGLEKVINPGKESLYVLYRDEVLDEAASKCHTYEEIRTYWVDYRYGNDRMDDDFTKCMDKLKAREKNWDIKVYHYIMENYKTIPCFTDANHPSKYVMKEVGRQIAPLLGLSDIDDEGYEPDLGLKVPVMKGITEYFGLDFQVSCERRREYFGKMAESDIDDYIRAYLWWYHGIGY